MLISDHIYVLDSTKGAYAYLIRGVETVLIDTGFSFRGKKITDELKSIKVDPKEIKHILLTHHDLDHIGNAALLQKLTGAQIWASREDIPYISGANKRPGIKRIFSTLLKPKTPDSIKAYEDHQMIGEVEVIPTPGHTPGHVCFLYRDVLFAGDLVKTQNGKIEPYINPLMTWNKEALLQSFEKIKSLSHKWICPAHGTPTEIGK